jgi:hypothetical protein
MGNDVFKDAGKDVGWADNKWLIKIFIKFGL